ncbi:unnamed protein product [Peronospora destructor]|uniref:LNS2/PITP domain-containing protein n=1 Tax=Peronospora destructor TaxID=86335 RepID=A0AAV0U8N2_9STRA|nr:unnamed protein product [Peronospora destructor]
MDVQSGTSSLVKATSSSDISDHEAMVSSDNPSLPLSHRAPLKSMSTSAIDDHENYDLFGCGDVSLANRTILQVAPVEKQETALPVYKMAGNAVDIVAVKNTDGKYLTTSWHVSFSWSRFRTSYATGVGDMVRILMNGKELPTKMELLERGRCTFVTGGMIIPPEDLLFADLSEELPNHVRFVHFQKYTNTVRYVDAKLHLWGPNESVVVVDLDGTLTISDVEGHIRTLRLGQYDFLHAGACGFFTKLHELGVRIVYLTARPLDWATASRAHLENAVQQSIPLPPGVLITNSTGLTGALFTEVVNKTPHLFKIQVLNELQLTLIHAGRVVEHPVFIAGFGNRPTDIVAYEEVGMDRSLIFMLDSYSNVKAVSDPRLYESYSDPNVLLWLLPKLKHRVPIEKVGRIDDYTVRELVLAEDREQLRMAEIQARQLQQEEFERARQEANQARNYSSRNAYRPSSKKFSRVPERDDAWRNRRGGTNWATDELTSAQQRKVASIPVRDLEALDFGWNADEARWNHYFLPAIQRYRELHGSAQVPPSFVVPYDNLKCPAELGGYRLGQKEMLLIRAESKYLRCGNALDTTSDDEMWQEVGLVCKNWMMLKTLHEVEESVVLHNEEVDEQSID